MKTIDQQIATAQAKLNRLKTKQRASDTRRKIIVGSVVISEALRDPDAAQRLLKVLRQTVTREVDLKDVQGLIDQLETKR